MSKKYNDMENGSSGKYQTNPMCCCILDIFQITAVLKLEYKLFVRRIFLYIIFLLIPIVGFTFVKVCDQMNKNFLKPKFDAVLRKDNPFGKPFTSTDLPLSLPEVQYGVYQNLERDIDSIPTEILYDGSDVDIDSVNDLLKFVIDYNLTYTLYKDYIENKKGLTFIQSDEDSIDETIYESLYDEEFNDKTFNPYLGAFIFDHISEDSLEYTIQYEEKVKRNFIAISIQSTLLQMKNNYTSTSSFCRNVGIVSLGFECETFMAFSLMGLINSAYIFQQTGTITQPKISQFPYESKGMVYQSDIGGDYRSTVWFPMMLCSTLTLYVYILVNEKETGYRTLASLMGLKRRNYLFAKYLVFYIFFFIFAYSTYIYGRFILKFRIFTQVHPSIWFLLFVGHGFALTSFSFLFSTLFTSAYASIIPCLFVAFAVPGILGVIDERVMVKGSFNLVALELVFPYQITDATIQLLRPCILQKISIGSDFIYKDVDFLVSLLCTYLFGAVYFIIYLYLDKVLPQRGMVRRSPFFVFTEFFNLVDDLCCCCCSLNRICSSFLKYICCLFCLGYCEKYFADEFDSEDRLSYMDSDVRKESELISNMEPSEYKNYGIVVNKIRKRYKRRGPFAVNGVSFRVGKNELFGLLGENGAGKTTTIRMLVGEISISGGQAQVLGRDVHSQTSEIRRFLGVCPQFDILYPELTAREHLDFYSSIRGAGFDIWERRRHVEDLMRETELMVDEDEDEEEEEEGGNGNEEMKVSNRKQTHQKRKKSGCVFLSKIIDWMFNIKEKRVSKLSAGDRRKLSLAISLVGFPPLLFLDEPTTGLGPFAKRNLWGIIRRLKKNKSIILTTHSMEEADFLSDRIGIMAKGDMICIGTSLHLKHKFGKGYRLSVNFEKGRRNDVIKFINETASFKNSRFNSKQKKKKKIVLDFAESLIWEMSRESLSVSHLINNLEENKQKMGIRDWSINQTSLKDVFVNLVSESNKNKKKAGEMDNNEEERSLERIEHLEEEVRGLKDRLKRYNLLEESECGEESEEEVISIENLEVDNSSEGNSDSGEEEEGGEDESAASSSDGDEDEEDISGSGTATVIISSIVGSDKEEIFIDDDCEEKRKASSERFLKNEKESLIAEEREKMEYQEKQSQMMQKNCLLVFLSQLYVLLKKEFYLAFRNFFSTTSQISFGGILVISLYVIFYTGTVGESKKFFEEHEVKPIYPCQTFDQSENCYQIVYSSNGNPFGKEIISYIVENNNGEIITAQLREFESSKEMLDWVMTHPNLTISALSIYNSTETTPSSPYPVLKYTIYNNMTTLSGPNGDLVPITARLQQLIDEAILNLRTTPVVGRKKSIRVKLKSFPLFRLKEKPAIYDVYSHFGPSFFCVLVFFVFVFSANTYVLQKSRGLHSFLKSNGLRTLPLCCSYSIAFSAFGVLQMVIVFIIGYVCGIPVMMKTNVVVFFSIFLLFTSTFLASLSMSLPLMKKVNDVAAFVSFLVFIFFFVCSLFDSDLLYATYAQTETSWIAWVILYVILPPLFSPLNFCKIYGDMNFKSAPTFDYKRKVFVENDGYSFKDLFVKNTHEELGLETEATILWICYLFMNIIVYLSIGCCIHFCTTTRIYLRKGRKPRKTFENGEDISVNRIISENVLDENLISGKGDSNNNRDSKKDCIIVEDIHKTYKSWFSRNNVLEGVNLTVKENELVIILGHNGVGKSSFLNLITGDQRINQGEIFVNNRSIKRSPRNIQKEIGIVPQYDVLLEKMKAKEILEMFGVCKGMKYSKVKSQIDDVLKKVGLLNVKNDLVGSFSGGMKRRLSCALSMMGNPHVMLIDEPTVGIDPYSCYKICKIFYDMKKNHSLIITTHDLQEAELLSDKIAILHDKKIQCFGTSHQLKSICDTGYSLSIILKSDDDGLQQHQIQEEFEAKKSERTKSGDNDSDDDSDGNTSIFEENNIESNRYYLLMNTFIKKYLPHAMLVKSGMNCYVYSVARMYIQDLCLATKKLEEMEMKNTQEYSDFKKESKERMNENEDKEEESSDDQQDVLVEDEEVQDQGEESFLVSWGISQATLEDVYMKVTFENLFCNKTVENESNHRSSEDEFTKKKTNVGSSENLGHIDSSLSED